MVGLSFVQLTQLARRNLRLFSDVDEDGNMVERRVIPEIVASTAALNKRGVCMSACTPPVF